MTNEEEIEELLHEAAAYGLRLEVMETAKQILDENPNMSKVNAYSLAYKEWVK
jgi:hypothetical protein